MNLFFFQNCISPHQIPFIEELSVFTDVDRVVVIAPRVDYDDRKLMGWKTSKLLETKGSTVNGLKVRALSSLI